jgi:DNA mismatch repair protein MutS
MSLSLCESPGASDCHNSFTGRPAAAADAIWCELVAAVGQNSKELSAAAEAAADVDALQSLAEVAEAHCHVRPRVQESEAVAVWDVRDGRHLVIENLMHKRGACFVPNYCCLSPPASVMLLSGTNMGGKSTFLRQNALIAILAQVGAFVPASSKHQYRRPLILSCWCYFLYFTRDTYRVTLDDGGA